VEDAIDTNELEIQQLGIRVLSALEPAPTLGDRVLLQRLVANLVDNAVRHNVEGGSIQIATAADGGRRPSRSRTPGP